MVLTSVDQNREQLYEEMVSQYNCEKQKMKYNILIGNEGEEHLIDIGVKVAAGREGRLLG